jgi:hypothetical protein
MLLKPIILQPRRVKPLFTLFRQSLLEAFMRNRMGILTIGTNENTTVTANTVIDAETKAPAIALPTRRRRIRQIVQTARIVPILLAQLLDPHRSNWPWSTQKAPKAVPLCQQMAQSKMPVPSPNLPTQASSKFLPSQTTWRNPGTRMISLMMEGLTMNRIQPMRYVDNLLNGGHGFVAILVE